MNPVGTAVAIRGAYGFRISGVPGAARLLVDAPQSWPELTLLVHITSAAPPPREYVDDEVAVLLPRSGGWLKLDRRAGEATFSLPERPRDEALVHPHLASAAVVNAHWLGRESFHAGAFAASGQVWGMLGDRNAGKSSFLALLARAGVPVICDDLLVLDGLTALAGPRSIDLRADAAQHLGIGELMGVMGARERWRLALAPVAPELPIGGWVSLRWAEKAGVCRLRGAERLEVLGAHRGSALYPSTPERMLDLAGLPFFQLRRPRSWERSEEALHLLLDALG